MGDGAEVLPRGGAAPPEVAAELACAPRTRRLAQRLLGQDAADGIQEVFAVAQRALPGFRGEARLQTWFHRLAIRTLCAFRRRRDRDRERFEPVPDAAACLDEATLRRFAATPFDAVAASERRARVLAALDLLSPPLREVVLLRHEGLSYAEIAAALELPLGTVKSRLAAAMVQLASRLHADDEEDER